LGQKETRPAQSARNSGADLPDGFLFYHCYSEGIGNRRMHRQRKPAEGHIGLPVIIMWIEKQHIRIELTQRNGILPDRTNGDLSV